MYNNCTSSNYDIIYTAEFQRDVSLVLFLLSLIFIIYKAYVKENKHFFLYYTARNEEGKEPPKEFIEM